MYEILNYLMCFTSLMLFVLFLIHFKKNMILQKFLKIGEVLQRNNLNMADLGTSFNLIFLDVESEQKFLNIISTHNYKKAIIFYNAPDFRVKLFEKKIRENMVLCIDKKKELSWILDVKDHPSLFEVNYAKRILKKIL